MGFFWQGLPPYVITWSRRLLPSPVVAIETGTFQGDTSALLAAAFGRCVTIERSGPLAEAARRRFADDPRVTVLEGSSRDRLEEALPTGSESCFFWLDAHGIYDYAGPDTDENPLLHELATLMAARQGRPVVIAVDDARGMGTQPEWPPLADVFRVLDDHGFGAVIIDDVLVAAPKELDPDFTALYRMSRTVQVSAVFHIWPQVMGAARVRRWSDRAITGVVAKVRR